MTTDREQLVAMLRRARQYAPMLGVRASVECAAMALPMFESGFESGRFVGRDEVARLPRQACEVARGWARGDADIFYEDIEDAYHDINNESPASGASQQVFAAYRAAQDVMRDVLAATDGGWDDEDYVIGSVIENVLNAGVSATAIENRLRDTWAPTVLDRVRRTVWVWRGENSGALGVPKLPYKQEWPLVLRFKEDTRGSHGQTHIALSLAEAWESKHFTPEMFIAIDNALEDEVQNRPLFR